MEYLANIKIALPSVIILMVIAACAAYLLFGKAKAGRKTSSPGFFKKIIYLPVKIKKIVCIALIILLFVFLWYLNKGGGSGEGPGSGSAPSTAAHVQQESPKEENPLPPKEPEIVPEKQVRFDVKDFEELAKQGFPPNKLPDYLILKYVPQKNLHLLISMNDLVDHPVNGKDEEEFWKNLEETLNQIQNGELPKKESSSQADHTVKKVKADCAGILLINAPTKGIRDNTENIIQKYFPENKVETFKDGKKN